MTKSKKPVVFFDRDGTLNVEAGYIHDLNNLVLAEGAAESVKKLNDLGVITVLVTNQSGPARGYYAEDHVLALNNRLISLLKDVGAYLDAIYYCPHIDPAQGKIEKYTLDCDCRKPKTGMIDQAIKDHPEIDMSRAYVVGDKATDVDLAYNAGCKGVLLTTGFGQRVLDGTYQELPNKPHFIAHSITEAVNWIIKDLEEIQ